MLLEGIFPPVTTPFDANGGVYLKKLEANVAHYSKTPVAGLVVLGSTGEAVMLSDEERRLVLRSAREAAAPTKVLIAGTGVESARETLSLSEYAAELGYDVALVRTPFYYRRQMQPQNLLAFYRMVADRSPIPVMIYSVPAFTQYDIPVEVAAELAEHPNLIGIKESSGDVEKVRRLAEATSHIRRSVTVTETFQAVTPRMLESTQAAKSELVPAAALAGSGTSRGPSAPVASSSSSIRLVGGLKTRPKEVGFQILVGAAHKLHASLAVGAGGGILAFACPAPTACYEVYAAWKEGDQELARLKQERITQAAIRVGSELGIPALKYAMDLNGYYGGLARLPLLPLTANLKAQVEQAMADIRN